MGRTTEPVAMMMFLVSSVCLAPSAPVTSTFPGKREFSGAFENRHLVFLHQVFDTLGVLQHHFVFAFLHIGKSQLNPG